MAAISLGIAALMAAGAGATAASTIYAAKKQSSAAERAGDLSAASIDQQMEMEQENEERRRMEWDQTQAENAARYETARLEEQRRFEISKAESEAVLAEDRRRYENEETRRAPYRAVSKDNLNQLSQLTGVSFRNLGGKPPEALPMPAPRKLSDLPSGGA